MKSAIKRTMLTVLLFPICLVLLVVAHWLTTKFLFWLAPTGKAYTQNLFSDSSLGIAAASVAGIISWFVQQCYLRFASRRAGILLAMTYLLVSTATLFLFIWAESYYSAFGTTIINIGQLIGLLAGRENGKQPTLT